MPTALPDYVQSPIREVILTKYPRGMKSLAEEMGSGYMTVVSTFKRNKHVSLKCFLELCEILCIEPEDMALILDLPPSDRKITLWKMMDWDSHVTPKDLTRGEKDLENYFYAILRGVSARQIKDIYKPMAAALNMSLSELAAALLYN